MNAWGKVAIILVAVGLVGWLFAHTIHARMSRWPSERERMRW